VKLPPETHPVWRIITLAVMMTGITGCLWLNASSFDATEVTSLAQFAAWVAGYELLKNKISAKND